MTENEFILFDRLEVIKKTIEQYGEDSFYLSFSGGKDSTVVHHLLDMAIPGNKIPRVYSNTGIEYSDIVKFVKEMQEADDRIVIIKPSRNIKKTLEEVGYPFKSKEYSEYYGNYQKYKDLVDPYIEEIERNPELANDYDYIHNLPPKVKFPVKEYFGKREREREVCTSSLGVPNILKYQWHSDFNLKISDKCCEEMKEKPIKKYEKTSGRKNKILGLMKEEGGRRTRTSCIITKGKHVSFQPLAVISKEWEEWFIETYNIKLCRLYYEPFNFQRTGCKGCPYSLDLQNQLETMALYLPNEKAQCEYIWKPVYEEYRRIGYRLKGSEQGKLF